MPRRQDNISVNKLVASQVFADNLSSGNGSTDMPTTITPAASAATDSATLTIAELLTGVISGTPTNAATYTLPTAALAVAGVTNPLIGSSFDFTIQNLSTVNTYIITVAAGTGGSIVGNIHVEADVSASFTTATGQFRLRFTNVTSGAEAYVVYRIA
jgi:hypothetical protein